MNEFDIRQLNIMLDKMERFTQGKLDLGYLLEDLEALLQILESIDEEWKTEFRSEWINIEEVYAYHLSQQSNRLNQDDFIIIEESLTKMKEMIKNLLLNKS